MSEPEIKFKITNPDVTSMSSAAVQLLADLLIGIAKSRREEDNTTNASGGNHSRMSDH